MNYKVINYHYLIDEDGKSFWSSVDIMWEVTVKKENCSTSKIETTALIKNKKEIK